MRIQAWAQLVLFWFCLGCIFPAIGHSSDSDRQTLTNLLLDLEKKIQEADQRMVAHPKFLDELRALVQQYRARLREVFFSEDFSDGDYTRNPTWVVDSGRFQISESRRLFTQVAVERPVAAPSKEEESSPLGLILKEVVRSTLEKGESKSPPQEAGEARIHTLAGIGSAFEVDLNLVSKSSWGAKEVVLLGGDPLRPLYRMVYHAAPSADRPIEIVRERGARSYLIEAATQYPSFDDGMPHRLQWIRDSQGRMRVLVDGGQVLSTVEVFYRGPFAGLALVNRGGTYEWGPIRVLKALEEGIQ